MYMICTHAHLVRCLPGGSSSSTLWWQLPDTLVANYAQGAQKYLSFFPRKRSSKLCFSSAWCSAIISQEQADVQTKSNQFYVNGNGIIFMLLQYLNTKRTCKIVQCTISSYILICLRCRIKSLQKVVNFRQVLHKSW